MASKNAMSVVDPSYRVKDQGYEGGNKSYYQRNNYYSDCEYCDLYDDTQVSVYKEEHLKCSIKCRHVIVNNQEAEEANTIYDDADYALEHFGSLFMPHQLVILLNLWSTFLRGSRTIAANLEIAVEKYNENPEYRREQRKGLNERALEMLENKLKAYKERNNGQSVMEDDHSDSEFDSDEETEEGIIPIQIEGITERDYVVGTPEYNRHKQSDFIRGEYYSNTFVRTAPVADDDRVSPQPLNEDEARNGNKYYSARLKIWQVALIRLMAEPGYEKHYHRDYDWERKFIKRSGIVIKIDNHIPDEFKEYNGIENWFADRNNQLKLEEMYPGTQLNWDQIKKKNGRGRGASQYKTLYYTLVGNRIMTPSKAAEVISAHLKADRNTVKDVAYWEQMGIPREYQEYFPKTIDISHGHFKTKNRNATLEIDNGRIVPFSPYLTIRDMKMLRECLPWDELYEKSEYNSKCSELRLDWIPPELQEERIRYDLYKLCYSKYQEDGLFHNQEPIRKFIGKARLEKPEGREQPDYVNRYDVVYKVFEQFADNETVKIEDVLNFCVCPHCGVVVDNPDDLNKHLIDEEGYTIHRHECQDCGDNFKHIAKCKPGQFTVQDWCPSDQCRSYCSNTFFAVSQSLSTIPGSVNNETPEFTTPPEYLELDQNRKEMEQRGVDLEEQAQKEDEISEELEVYQNEENGVKQEELIPEENQEVPEEQIVVEEQVVEEKAESVQSLDGHTKKEEIKSQSEPQEEQQEYGAFILSYKGNHVFLFKEHGKSVIRYKQHKKGKEVFFNNKESYEYAINNMHKKGSRMYKVIPYDNVDWDKVSIESAKTASNTVESVVIDIDKQEIPEVVVQDTPKVIVQVNETEKQEIVEQKKVVVNDTPKVEPQSVVQTKIAFEPKEQRKQEKFEKASTKSGSTKSVTFDDNKNKIINIPSGNISPPTIRKVDTTGSSWRRVKLDTSRNSRDLVGRNTEGKNTEILQAIKAYKKMDPEIKENKLVGTKTEQVDEGFKDYYYPDSRKPTPTNGTKVPYGAYIAVQEEHGLYFVNAWSGLGEKMVAKANERKIWIQWFFAPCKVCCKTHRKSCWCQCERHEIEYNWYGQTHDLCRTCAVTNNDSMVAIQSTKRVKCSACNRYPGPNDRVPCKFLIRTLVPQLQQKLSFINQCAKQNMLTQGLQASQYMQTAEAFERRDEPFMRKTLIEYTGKTYTGQIIGDPITFYTSDLSHSRSFNWSSSDNTVIDHENGNKVWLVGPMSKYTILRPSEIPFEPIYRRNDSYVTAWIKPADGIGLNLPKETPKLLRRADGDEICKKAPTKNQAVGKVIKELDENAWDERPLEMKIADAKIQYEEKEKVLLNLAKVIEINIAKDHPEEFVKKSRIGVMDECEAEEIAKKFAEQMDVTSLKVAQEELRKQEEENKMNEAKDDTPLIQKEKKESVFKTFAQAAKETLEDVVTSVKEVIPVKKTSYTRISDANKCIIKAVANGTGYDYKTLKNDVSTFLHSPAAISWLQHVEGFPTEEIDNEVKKFIAGEMLSTITVAAIAKILNRKIAVKPGDDAAVYLISVESMTQKEPVVVLHCNLGYDKERPWASTHYEFIREKLPENTIFMTYAGFSDFAIDAIKVDWKLKDKNRPPAPRSNTTESSIISTGNLKTLEFTPKEVRAITPPPKKEEPKWEKVSNGVPEAVAKNSYEAITPIMIEAQSIDEKVQKPEILEKKSEVKEEVKLIPMKGMGNSTREQTRIECEQAYKAYVEADDVVTAMENHRVYTQTGMYKEFSSFEYLKLFLDLEETKKELTGDLSPFMKHLNFAVDGNFRTDLITTKSEFRDMYTELFNNINKYCMFKETDGVDINDFKRDLDKLTPEMVIRREIYRRFAADIKLWKDFIFNIYRSWFTRTQSTVYVLAKYFKILAPIIDAFHHIEIFEQCRAKAYVDIGVQIPVVNKSKTCRVSIHDMDKFNPYSCCALLEQFGNRVSGVKEFSEVGEISKNYFSIKYVDAHCNRNYHHENATVHDQFETVEDTEAWLLECFVDKASRHCQKTLNNRVDDLIWAYDVAKWFKGKEEHKKRILQIQDMFLKKEYSGPTNTDFENKEKRIDYEWIKERCQEYTRQGIKPELHLDKIKQELNDISPEVRKKHRVLYSRYFKDMSTISKLASETETSCHGDTSDADNAEEQIITNRDLTEDEISKQTERYLKTQRMQKNKYIFHSGKIAKFIRMHSEGDMNDSVVLPTSVVESYYFDICKYIEEHLPMNTYIEYATLMQFLMACEEHIIDDRMMLDIVKEEFNMSDITEFISLQYYTHCVVNSNTFQFIILHRHAQLCTKNKMYNGAEFQCDKYQTILITNKFRKYVPQYPWQPEEFVNTVEVRRFIQGLNDFVLCGYCDIPDNEIKNVIRKMKTFISEKEILDLCTIPYNYRNEEINNGECKLGSVKSTMVYKTKNIVPGILKFCKNNMKYSYLVELSENEHYEVSIHLLTFIQGKAAAFTKEEKWIGEDDGDMQAIYLKEPIRTNFETEVENDNFRYQEEVTSLLGSIYFIDITDSRWFQKNQDYTKIHQDLVITWDEMLKQFGKMSKITNIMVDLMKEVKSNYPSYLPLVWISYLVNTRMSLSNVLDLYRNRYYCKNTSTDDRWRFGNERVRFKFVGNEQGQFDFDISNTNERQLTIFLATGQVDMNKGSISHTAAVKDAVIYVSNKQEAKKIHSVSGNPTKVVQLLNLDGETKLLFTEDELYITTTAVVKHNLSKLIMSISKLYPVKIIEGEYKYGVVKSQLEFDVYGTNDRIYEDLNYTQSDIITRNAQGKIVGFKPKTREITMVGGETEKVLLVDGTCEWAYIFPRALKITRQLQSKFQGCLVTRAGVFGSGPKPTDVIQVGTHLESHEGKFHPIMNIAVPVNCKIIWDYATRPEHTANFQIFKYNTNGPHIVTWDSEYGNMKVVNVVKYGDSKEFRSTYRAIKNLMPSVENIKDISNAIEYCYHAREAPEKCIIEQGDLQLLAWLTFNGTQEVAYNNDIVLDVAETIRSKAENTPIYLLAKQKLASMSMYTPLRTKILVWFQILTFATLLFVPLTSYLVYYFTHTKKERTQDYYQTQHHVQRRHILSVNETGIHKFGRVEFDTVTSILFYCLYLFSTFILNFVAVALLQMAKKPTVVFVIVILTTAITNGMLVFTHLAYIHALAVCIKLIELSVISIFADPLILLILGLRWSIIAVLNYYFLAIEVYIDVLLLVSGLAITICSAMTIAWNMIKTAKFQKKVVKDENGKHIKTGIKYANLALNNHMKGGPTNTPLSTQAVEKIVEPKNEDPPKYNDIVDHFQSGELTTVGDFAAQSEFLVNPTKTMLHNLALRSGTVKPAFSCAMLKYTGVVRNETNSFIGHFFIADKKIHFNTHFLEREAAVLNTTNRRSILQTFKFYLPVMDEFVKIKPDAIIESYSDWTMVETDTVGGRCRSVKTMDKEPLMIILWIQEGDEVVPKTVNCEGKEGMASIVSYAGYCGAPYVDTEGRVVAMHYAGNPNMPTNYKMEYENVLTVKNSLRHLNPLEQDNIIGVHRLNWNYENKGKLQSAEQLIVGPEIVDRNDTSDQCFAEVKDDVFNISERGFQTLRNDEENNFKPQTDLTDEDVEYGALTTYFKHTGENNTFIKPASVDLIQQNILAAQLQQAKKMIKEMFPEENNVTHERLYYTCIQIAGIIFPKFGTKVYALLSEIYTCNQNDWSEPAIQLYTTLVQNQLVDGTNDKVFRCFINTVLYQIFVSRYFTNLTPEYAIWYLWCRGYSMAEIKAIMKHFTGQWDFLKKYGYNVDDVKKQWVDHFGSPLPQSDIKTVVTDADLRSFLYQVANMCNIKISYFREFCTWFMTFNINELNKDSNRIDKEKIIKVVYKFIDSIIDTDNYDVKNFISNLCQLIKQAPDAKTKGVAELLKFAFGYDRITEAVNIINEIVNKTDFCFNLKTEDIIFESYRRWIVVKTMNPIVRNKWIKSFNAQRDYKIIQETASKLSEQDKCQISTLIRSAYEAIDESNLIKFAVRRYYEPFSGPLPSSQMSYRQQSSGLDGERESLQQVSRSHNANAATLTNKILSGEQIYRENQGNSDITELLEKEFLRMAEADEEQAFATVDEYERWKRQKFGRYCVDLKAFENTSFSEQVKQILKAAIKNRKDPREILRDMTTLMKFVNENSKKYNRLTDMVNFFPDMPPDMRDYYNELDKRKERENSKHIAVATKGKILKDTSFRRNLEIDSYNEEYVAAKNMRRRGRRQDAQSIDEIESKVDFFEEWVEKAEKQEELESGNYKHATLESLERIQARLEEALKRVNNLKAIPKVGTLKQDIMKEISSVKQEIKSLNHMRNTTAAIQEKQRKKMDSMEISGMLNDVVVETMRKESTRNAYAISKRKNNIASTLSSASHSRQFLNSTIQGAQKVMERNIKC